MENTTAEDTIFEPDANDTLPEAQPETQPAVSKPSPAPASNGNGGSSNKDDIRDMAQAFALKTYVYAAALKNSGHITISEMLFKDVMALNLNAHLLGSAVGRDRFLKFLEETYYYSGRIIEYLEFISKAGIQCEGHELLTEDAITLHKIYSASVRTAKAKPAQKVSKF